MTRHPRFSWPAAPRWSPAPPAASVHAIAGALGARGVRLLVSGAARGASCHAPAEDLGARAVVCDLAVAEDVERLGRRSARGRRRRARRQRRAARHRPAQRAHPGRDRPHARRQPAGPDRAGARPGSGDGRRAGAGIWCSCRRCSGKVGVRRPPRCTRPRSSDCAGSRLALREDLRGTGVGVSVVAPGFIREAGMFANTGVKLPPGVGTQSPAGRRRRGHRERSSATAPRSTSHRWACVPGPRLARWRRGRPAG